MSRRTRAVLLPAAGALLGLVAVGLAHAGGGVDLPWPVPVLAGFGLGLLAAVAQGLPGGDPCPPSPSHRPARRPPPSATGRPPLLRRPGQPRR